MALMIAIFITPRFEQIFSDYGVDLPSSTVTAITVSHVATRMLPVVALAFVGLLALDFYVIKALDSTEPRSGFLGRWVWMMTLIPLALLGFQLIAVGLVWLQLQGKLTG